MSVFHEGELAIQAKAGTTHMAERVGKGISNNAQLYASFLEQLDFAVAGSVDKEGHVWATPLSGNAGFMSLEDNETLNIKTPVDDRLSENLKADSRLGLLVLAPFTRRRLRLNGQASIQKDGLQLHTKEVFGNCPKYIQKRDLKHVEVRSQTTLTEGKDLTSEIKAWLKQADTFFITSNNPKGNLDVSHRGGQPGFIHVEGNTVLSPDYQGNMMFNTLGNIQENPQVGLVFIDFEKGHTLQLYGAASILWDDASKDAFIGAERVVSLNVEGYRMTQNAMPIRGNVLEFSPHNPS